MENEENEKKTPSENKSSSGWGNWFSSFTENFEEKVQGSVGNFVTGFFGEEEYKEEGLKPKDEEEDSSSEKKNQDENEDNEDNNQEDTFSEFTNKTLETLDRGFDTTAEMLGGFFSSGFDSIASVSSQVTQQSYSMLKSWGLDSTMEHNDLKNSPFVQVNGYVWMTELEKLTLSYAISLAEKKDHVIDTHPESVEIFSEIAKMIQDFKKTEQVEEMKPLTFPDTQLVIDTIFLLPKEIELNVERF